jgi:hypothetical protein
VECGAEVAVNPQTSIQAWAYLIECDLATLEELQMLKSSSKSRTARQENICRSAVAYFRQYGDIEAARRVKAIRLVKILEGT